MKKFRFENLEIWHEAIQIALILFEIADTLEEKKLWRFTDQLRGVGMSIPNNIAESTGSDMIGEQRMSLRISKKECYEAANILIILELKKLIHVNLKIETYNRLDLLSRRIESYSKSLSTKRNIKNTNLKE